MKKTAPLSMFEQKIWEFILGYFEDWGWSPTRTEIAKGILPKSTPQAIDRAIQNMKQKGWLKTGTGWRNIIDPKKYETEKL